MSAIAYFTLFPKPKLEGLRDASALKGNIFRAPKDPYYELIERHGKDAVTYDYSGYLMATLLVYLEEHKGINLRESEYSGLASLLSEKRGVTHYIFTDEHRRKYADELLFGEFSERELCDYYNEFNAASETEVGGPLVEGIHVVWQSLQKLDSESVILFRIF